MKKGLKYSQLLKWYKSHKRYYSEKTIKEYEKEIKRRQRIIRKREVKSAFERVKEGRLKKISGKKAELRKEYTGYSVYKVYKLRTIYRRDLILSEPVLIMDEKGIIQYFDIYTFVRNNVPNKFRHYGLKVGIKSKKKFKKTFRYYENSVIIGSASYDYFMKYIIELFSQAVKNIKGLLGKTGVMYLTRVIIFGWN